MSRRPAMTSNHDNQHGAGYDALIARHPPEIVWRLNNRGVLIAVSVIDPLAERDAPTRQRARELGIQPTGQPRNADKTHCKWGHEFTEANTINRASRSRECRTCKNERRSINPDLTAAARRDI